MADAPLRFLLQHLHRSRAAPAAAGADDAALLERFVRARDEAAFELLVWRHGTMVYNVCRRVLRDAHAAEDAFQATFLVLVRKAASVGRREALAGWLYRVAYRVALRARSRTGPRTGTDIPEPVAEPSDEVLWRDLRPVLDEEVNRLPEKYRLPVVLCYLSGLTTDEAARRLGIARGTVLSRLAWARERLRARLSLRGVTLSAALLGTLLASEAAAPASALVRAVLSSVVGQTAVASPAAVTLMEGMLREMVMNKVKKGLLVVLVLALVGAGAGLWATRPATAEPVERKRDEAPRASAPAHAEPKETAKVHEPQRPVGVWERTLTAGDSTVQIMFRVEANRVTATYEDRAKGQTMKMTLEGEYSVTRDYVLYGVITGAEINVSGGTPEDANDAAEFAGLVIDHAFSARYRVDDNVLTLKDLKFGEFNTGTKDNRPRQWEQTLGLVRGRYKKKDAGKDEAPW